MSEWPPVYEDNFIIHESGTPPYWRKIVAELEARDVIRSLTNDAKFEVGQALFMIDGIASLAARSLRNSPFSASELFRIEQPKGANPFSGPGEKRRYKQWRRYREQQYSIEFCRRAREALLSGEWGEAAHTALYAGLHAHGDAALTAGTLLPGLRAGTVSVHDRASRNRKTILGEAKELAAEYSTVRKPYNIKTIAETIADRHKGEKGFPKYDAIRRILGQDRSWEIRA